MACSNIVYIVQVINGNSINLVANYNFPEIISTLSYVDINRLILGFQNDVNLVVFDYSINSSVS